MHITFSTIFSAAAAMATIACAAGSGSPMSHGAAVAKLNANDITIASSGGCTDRNNPKCTSLEGVLSGTVDTVISLKGDSGCSSLVITGGTETGHGDDFDKTHWKGYKLDVRHVPCLDNYIHNAFEFAFVRSDGACCWKAGDSGNLYCDEGSHWDVVFN
ncbi:hypothetical protein MVEG_11777 [Podila verticillata NRRL 6337]|uniref:Uncharacterized protein n=1 Tax=Podila verticillata NRRL 6337 TaxID=1069443 RepID=A0A086TJL1_9FUNG|nr:hypothetical protein MVEG_11777 [Podila verticillata NRRL 6337]